MTYKTIVVHLDTSQRAHPRLELALRLAKQFDAHLTGVFAVFSPDPRSLYVMAGTAEYYVTHEQLREERRGALERLFHAELSRAEVAGEWIAADAPASLALPHRGRCADLIIASQDDPNDPESYVGDFFPENLIMSAGRPVLLVPYASRVTSPGTHVMVCWDGSREATRAVHDALPFMRAAKNTTIVTLNGARDEPHSRIPGADIATLIARHGVNVEVKDIDVASDASIGDALLSQASAIGADLLVMGAYGHARWQELVMGGATRTILKSMTVPVLMSH
ncbi:MAG: universal stress protein [Paraburkholderia sp.]|jgi:nucleotide-binding universal stress UspA family protein|uniref:universal stress protein n=1 Tax=Paraburkholderia sp. TaxID=1926495 RepID=UPI003C4C8B7D